MNRPITQREINFTVWLVNWKVIISFFLHRLVSCLLLNTESGKIFACFVWQNQIIQTCETICFPFGEIVCANAARMKKNGVTTATILSGYISVSLLFFFLICNSRTYGYSLSKLWFFICILTIFRVHIP